jgi:hypothetical protein
MPGKPCSVCVSLHKEEVSAALLKGESERSIAERFPFSTSAIHRHKSTCLKEKISSHILKQEKADLREGGRHLRILEGLAGKAVQILKDAEAEKDRGTMLAAIREARASLETVMKWTYPSPDTAVQVNVLSQTSGISVEDFGKVLRILDRHPDIKREVADALSFIE